MTYSAVCNYVSTATSVLNNKLPQTVSPPRILYKILLLNKLSTHDLLFSKAK